MSLATAARRRNLYFAYGSNLSLGQMASRCPESRFVGRAVLYNYRWQINERGYANVIVDDNFSVEGLCYLLSEKDEARLDRNEGVHTGAYEKAELQVELTCRPAALIGRDVADIAIDGSLELLSNGLDQPNEGEGSDHKRPCSWPSGVEDELKEWQGSEMKQGEMTKALVYLSKSFIIDSLPREEYVDRMNAGIGHALALGISPHFIAVAIRPYISSEPETTEMEIETTDAKDRHSPRVRKTQKRGTGQEKQTFLTWIR
ncbi:hypothetical protein BKA65DRAFT_520014 [Rhexocercosporidium sp. MPI-PUGE-AT-0058]|nr:hypothetical protein BKA65DRAFT_520014 [Rhexocercosporidium sp. MPI-PUGE-AT-0058]